MIDARVRSPRIATARLLLRELWFSDARAVARSVGDRRVARQLVHVPSPYTTSLARRWIRSRVEWWPLGRGVAVAIAERAEPAALLGAASLRRPPALRHGERARRAELGYWLAPGAWGHGYATEAAAALVEFGFRELGLLRIDAQVFTGNTASMHVLEKLGMAREGMLPQHVRSGGRLHDVVCYGLSRSAWLAL